MIILDFGGDIKDDSLLVGYENKIETVSYSHNVAVQVISDISNPKRISGKSHVGEFILTKFIDISTPTLNEYCCVGKPIIETAITTNRSTVEGNGQIMSSIVYTSNNVVPSNVNVNGGAGGKPVETLSSNLTKIKRELTVQKDDGTKEGTAASTWDPTANQLAK